MFRFIFDIATDPLRLPIEWYYEWIILFVIGCIAYSIAYDKVGRLYHGDFISGRVAGSFFHWIIRTFYFIVMWAITYGVIWTGRFILSHKVEVGIGIGSVIVAVIVVKLLIWNNERKKLAKVKIKIGEDEDQ